ncbi:MAG TPA: efflux RND transporter periplasmic adaptor subunit [Planctomycetaceae bacterium]|nr:efflux RND transporter periplasmic adaptor subunit [Planctomycetaceae bacterium]
MSSSGRIRKLAVRVLVLAAIGAGLVWGWRRGWHESLLALWQRVESPESVTSAEAPTAAVPFEIVEGRVDTIRFVPSVYQDLGISTVAVRSAPPPEPLRMAGSLVIDPNRLIRVHSRFSGEVVAIKMLDETASGNIKPNSPVSRSGVPQRSLRYGDRVKRGDVLAVVWSKEIGEKKSELVDALSKLDADKKLLARLESVEEGVVAKKLIIEARRNVDANLVAVARAERTLRSWRLTDDEIKPVFQEAAELREGRSDISNDNKWAEVQILSPIDGVIVEKNFNEGAIVEPTDDLFQIADLSRLLVLANAYEEDLPALRKLPLNERRWTVDHKADPNDLPIPGEFEVIGSIIDPNQHTGTVMGWVDNREGNLASGQFITATVVLPPEPHLVAIPTSAVVEEGDSSSVFVETDAARLEFERRRIAIKRRGRDLVFVESISEAAETRADVQPLRIGENVIVSGALEIAAELESRKSVAFSP